jgi:hypothetical protein
MKTMKFAMLVVAVVAVVAFAGTAGADETIFKGLDIFYTPSGGGNITVPIPAGFFCGGASAAQTRTISLKGRPLVTAPAGKINPGDTVVDREADIGFGGGLTATGNLRIRALDLVSVSGFTVLCPGGLTEVYNTEVSLNGAQGLGTIDIRRAVVGARSGRFDASFPVNAKVRFRNAATGVPTAFLTRHDTITTLDACWSHDPGPGAVVCAGQVILDVDGNRVITAADHTSPYCTPNFFPGWEWRGGILVKCPTEHDGPHPTTCSAPGPGCPEQTPTDPCTQDVLQYLSAHANSNGFLLDDVSTLNSMFTIGEISGEKVEATRAFIGSVRIDRCIQLQGTAILQEVNGTANF